MSLLRPFAYFRSNCFCGRGGSKLYVLSTGIRGRNLSHQPDGTDTEKESPVVIGAMNSPT